MLIHDNGLKKSPEEQEDLDGWLLIEVRGDNLDGCVKAILAGANASARQCHCKRAHAPEQFLFTPLHYASRAGKIDLCQMLIKAGAHLDAVAQFDETPLMRAIENGYFEVCLELLVSGADMDLRDQNKDTALHWAAAKGWPEICNLLVQRGACMDLRNINTFTPQGLALEVGYEDIFRLLGSMKQAKQAAEAIDAIGNCLPRKQGHGPGFGIRRGSASLG